MPECWPNSTFCLPIRIVIRSCLARSSPDSPRSKSESNPRSHLQGCEQFFKQEGSELDPDQLMRVIMQD
jgi:hypothetical protein